MMRLRRESIGVAMVTAVAFATVGITSCGGDDEPTGNGGNGGGGGVATPAAVQTFVSQNLIDAAAGTVDAFNRLLTAAEGGPADGVTITPTGPNSFSAAVDVDFDGDGTRESVINGFASGDIQTGASVGVSSVVIPGVSGSLGASSVVTETGPGAVSFDAISASATDASGTDGGTIFDGSVALNLATGTPSGFLDWVVFGLDDNDEFQELSGTTTFEPDGSGGWQAHFSGDGFDFTVP